MGLCTVSCAQTRLAGGAQNDLQAMARCHRIGQAKEVTIYRLVSRDTYEQNVFDCASRKQGGHGRPASPLGCPSAHTCPLMLSCPCPLAEYQTTWAGMYFKFRWDRFQWGASSAECCLGVQGGCLGYHNL